MHRSSSLFAEHLFKSALTSSNSHSITPIQNSIHESICLTDNNNRAQLVLNIQLPPSIPPYERHEIDQIIEILQQTYRAISTRTNPGSTSISTFSEAKIDELFDAMMLKKLQEQKDHLTIATVSEMRFVSYPRNDPLILNLRIKLR